MVYILIRRARNSNWSGLLSMKAMGCGQKSFKLVWRCHQLLSGFLAKGHLPWVSRQSRRSLMIRVIMKWSWGLCTDLLASYNWGKPQKTSARRPSDEGAVQPVITSNGIPFLQMRSVGLHSMSGREKEGNKERTGIFSLALYHFLLIFMKYKCTKAQIIRFIFTNNLI